MCTPCWVIGPSEFDREIMMTVDWDDLGARGFAVAVVSVLSPVVDIVQDNTWKKIAEE